MEYTEFEINVLKAKTIKYLGINLLKNQVLRNKICTKSKRITKLIKMIRELNQWRYFMFQVGSLNWDCSSQTEYRLSAFFIKITPRYFLVSEKLILKFTWKNKRPRFKDSSLRNMKVRGLTLPDAQTNKAATVKTAVY